MVVCQQEWSSRGKNQRLLKLALNSALEPREGTGAGESAGSPCAGRRPSMWAQLLGGGQGGPESFVGSVLIASFFSAKWEASSEIKDQEGGASSLKSENKKRNNEFEE